MGGVEEAMRMPGHEAACYRLGMSFVREASPYNRRLEQAGMIFNTMRRLRPQSAFGYIGIAEVKMRRREIGLPSDDSVAVIHDEAAHATRIAPHMADAYLTLGRADLLEGCLPCARRSAERAGELGADLPWLAMLQSQIAEQRGKRDEARVLLEQAAFAPGLRPETLYSLRLALGELELRARNYEAAERWLASAAEAEPEDPYVILRRAHVRLYDRGDVEGAVAIATQNPGLARTAEVKRVLAIARYVAWSRDRIAGRPAEDLGRLAQASYVGPESAWVACARHPVLAKEFAMMLEAGITTSVDARDDAGDTALLAAVAGGNEAAASLLVARGANVDAEDRYRHRPLLFAAERSDQALARLLLDAGAKVDYEDLDHRSPLLLAVQKQNAALAAMLLRHRYAAQPVPPRASDMLAAAAIADDTATLQVLLDAKIPADTAGEGRPTALVVAVLSRSRNAARLLLQYGADPAPALDAARAVDDHVLIELLRRSQKRSI
jgi:ankyrin repeat protein